MFVAEEWEFYIANAGETCVFVTIMGKHHVSDALIVNAMINTMRMT